jgi:hypothetical protein
MQSRASILVVDDDPVHLRIYGWIINAAGFHAVTAQVVSNGTGKSGAQCTEIHGEDRCGVNRIRIQTGLTKSSVSCAIMVPDSIRHLQAAYSSRSSVSTVK